MPRAGVHDEVWLGVWNGMQHRKRPHSGWISPIRDGRPTLSILRTVVRLSHALCEMSDQIAPGMPSRVVCIGISRRASILSMLVRVCSLAAERHTAL